MKKESQVFITLAIFLAFAIALAAFAAAAVQMSDSVDAQTQTIIQTQNLDASDAYSEVQKVAELGEKIPQSPDDVVAMGDAYLKQEWNKILANSKYTGPIHNFFLNHQLVFKILFNTNYEFSLTFICIFILWIFILVNVNKLASPMTPSGWYAFFTGLAASLILAHVGAIHGIVTGVLSFIYAKESWWIRILWWIAVFVALIILSFIDGIARAALKSAKEKKEKQEIKEKVEVLEAESEGKEEGRAITKSLRKFKNKMFGA